MTPGIENQSDARKSPERACIIPEKKGIIVCRIGVDQVPLGVDESPTRKVPHNQWYQRTAIIEVLGFELAKEVGMFVPRNLLKNLKSN